MANIEQYFKQAKKVISPRKKEDETVEMPSIKLDFHIEDYIVFVIGAPGSGKGTLCLNMSAEYDFVHLSVGDILREAVKNRDPLLDWTATMCINIAELIPAQTLAAILAKHMDIHKAKGRHRFIIDGFPRDINQVIAVEKAIGDPKFVLLFDCPGDEAKKRYLTRGLEGRDDTEALFDKRFAEFKDKLGPIMAYYQLEGKIMTVDTSGNSVESMELVRATLAQRDDWYELYWRSPW